MEGLEKAYGSGERLSIREPGYLEFLDVLVTELLNQDVGRGDVTTETVFREPLNGKGEVAADEDGVLAGIEEASWIAGTFGVRFRILKRDGQKIRKGEAVLSLEGPVKELMVIERVILNVLSRMSGIATETAAISKRAGKARIAGTRKTLWGPLDKKAVALGGGLTHRLGLWDSILIKDNHLSVMARNSSDPVADSLRLAWARKESSKFIEIEVRKPDDALRAAEVFRELKGKGSYPCIIMLDNMKPQEIKRAAGTLRRKNLRRHVILEASGGINMKNVPLYAKSGADVLSVGSLTHSSRALQFSMSVS